MTVYVGILFNTEGLGTAAQILILLFLAFNTYYFFSFMLWTFLTHLGINKPWMIVTLKVLRYMALVQSHLVPESVVASTREFTKKHTRTKQRSSGVEN